MAYVGHAFSISDEDIMMESSYVVHNHPPVKEIAVALLVFDVVGIVLRIVMTYNWAGSDCSRSKLGIFFAILGAVLFLPGFYYTRIA
ncbi:hypothetical protein KSP39_PZI010606 [Platanthera zijinensis]|uniref:Uncharacterized protein n=1 Tax=Platanthera zijinensis TaxID=2320716 RepID=A0AAP0BJ07_9ASPA